MVCVPNSHLLREEDDPLPVESVVDVYPIGLLGTGDAVCDLGDADGHHGHGAVWWGGNERVSWRRVAVISKSILK